MNKKINFKLISDIAVCIAMLSVLIGFIVFANKLSEYKNRIRALEVQYKLFEQDFNQLYEIDPGIKKVD